ncbi:rhodanese-like domain-containing protein [Candidatus Dependentiae bacterium]|nr:rhodanese-like domain-containing protein [Candidatus Dependentiae bacterium]
MKIKAIFLGILAASSIFMVNNASVSYVSCKEVADHIDCLSDKDESRWYLINVLPRYICQDCTIVNSINIPIHILYKKLKNSQKWPRNRKIIIYCAGKDCALSRHAYEIIKNLGFVDVQVLDGGIFAWQQDGYPVKGKCQFGYLNG